jgi:MFS family permease
VEQKNPLAPEPVSATQRGALLSGLSGFYLMGLGQFLSIFTSNMVQFGITLWAWDLTGKATQLVLVGVAGYIPRALLSVLAGTLADRWNRKVVLAISDFSTALAALALLLLFWTDSIQIWHLYLINALSGIFGAFQYPAYMAVIPTMVSKEHLPRANSLRSITQSASGIGAPLLAGAIIGFVQVEGLLIFDLIAFAIAFTILLVVQIPRPRQSKEGKAAQGTVLQETLAGFRYLLKNESLLAFFLLFSFSNIATGFSYPMMSPTILAKTGDDAVILGAVRSAGSVGFLAGGLLMSVWGGPKKRIHGVNLALIGWGVLGAIPFSLSWSLPAWLITSFFISVPNPIINANFYAIMQTKIPQDLQGRIYGLDILVTTLSFPISQVVAGLLADNVFEPASAPGGWLADSLGSLIGTGPGAGIGFTILIGGLISILVGLASYAIPRIREIETRMPDAESAAIPDAAL